MPKPVSRTCAVGADHQDIGRLDVLVDEAALVDLAERRRRCRWRGARSVSSSMGVPSSRASGSPPGSSSTSMVRPPSRTNSSGRTAHALSSSSFNAYSWARRSRLEGGGCSAAGSTASTATFRVRRCQAPSPAEHALAVLPQDLEAAIPHQRRTERIGPIAALHHHTRGRYRTNCAEIGSHRSSA